MQLGPFPYSPPPLKAAVDHLASLNETELAALNDLFTHLDAPINRRKMRTIAKSIHQKTGRLSEDEWENVASLALQLLSGADFMEFLEGFQAIDDKSGPNVKRVLDALKSNQSLEKVMAIDRVIERGPRLEHLSVSCDVRTHFSASNVDTAETTYMPREEFNVPLAIIRMKIDEVEQYIYFQMSDDELEEHIATLQKAREQLRYITETERR